MPNVIMSHRLRVRNRTTGEWDDIPAIGSGGGSIADLETEEADEMDVEEAEELAVEGTDEIGVDSAPTSGSHNLVESGGVYTALQNAVISGGGSGSGSGSAGEDLILAPTKTISGAAMVSTTVGEWGVSIQIKNNASQTNKVYLYAVQPLSDYVVVSSNSPRMCIGLTSAEYSTVGKNTYIENCYCYRESSTPYPGTYEFQTDATECTAAVYLGDGGSGIVLSKAGYDAILANAAKADVDKILSVIEPNDTTIPETAVAYHALYDEFVTGGYALRELLTTVRDTPIYGYYFSFKTKRKTANDSGGFVDYMPEEIPGSTYSGYYRKRNILFISGAHGKERGAPVALYRFLRKLCYDPDYVRYQAFDYYVVPLTNPTGYDDKTRNTYQDVNLNTDYNYSTTPETEESRAVRAFVDRGITYEIAVDFHQAPTIGSGWDQDYARVGYADLAYGMEPWLEEMVNEQIAKVGYVVDEAVNKYFNRPRDTQACYNWDHVAKEGGTMRNYAHRFSKASICMETSTMCAYYSHSQAQFNTGAMICGNTYQMVFTRYILDMVLDKFPLVPMHGELVFDENGVLVTGDENDGDEE